MVPVENQYEQACNALDAVKNGAGIASDKFALEDFLNYLSTHDDKNRDWFKSWVQSNKPIILNELEKEVSKSTKESFKLNFSTERIRLLLSRE
jgi:hypothetical protein